MSNVLVGLMMAAGVAAWVYSKMARSTGGNTQSALTVAGIAGFFAFVAMIMVLNAVGDLGL